MSIYISGSMAFDRIMTFPGKIKDSIIQDKLDSISISFMVDRMEEKFGGCAGNIAYAMALLEEKPIILSSVGRDFDPYTIHLQNLGLPLDGITKHNDLFTALCYITTDIDNSQITGFYPGAMMASCDYTFDKIDSENDLAIISPGNVDNMNAFSTFFKEKKVRYIYDPGQQIPVISAEELIKGISGSFALSSNAYELEMICQKTEKTIAEIQELTTWCITTEGAKGATITGKGEVHKIPAIPVDFIADPTGAGDAYRGGLLKGIAMNYDIVESARIASASASFSVEKFGTQLHTFTKEEFTKRYESIYEPLSKPLWR